MPIPSSRRALHQPFFPLYSSPPTQPPSASPPLPSPFPKYPSSSSSTSTRSPFFPLYPSPPPPPPTPSIPTFPANLSSVASPSHNTPLSSKLIPIIALPVLGLILLFLTATFVVLRRKRSSNKGGGDPGSDISRLVPPDATSSSDASKLAVTSAPASTEFLYLGTLVKPSGHVGTSGEVGPVAAESPELRPLPPLSRQARRSFSSDEEFYSPKDGRSPGAGARNPKCGSHSPASTLSTPTSSPASFIPPPPPPPPPPKDRSFLGKNEQKQPFFENPFASSPPCREAPPPPPPPPPPVQIWAGDAPKTATLQPPVLTPPKYAVAEVVSDGSTEDSDEGSKFEEYRRPKLKPLHWDKVRASSERAMVWDHLKSSSFQ